jgi:hypothetical protein
MSVRTGLNHWPAGFGVKTAIKVEVALMLKDAMV